MLFPLPWWVSTILYYWWPLGVPMCGVSMIELTNMKTTSNTICNYRGMFWVIYIYTVLSDVALIFFSWIVILTQNEQFFDCATIAFGDGFYHSLFNMILMFCVIMLLDIAGRYSSVGTANRYELDDPGIESRWGGEIFCTRPDRPRGPPSFLYSGYRVFPGKTAGAWRWPLTPIWRRGYGKSKAIPLLRLWAFVAVNFTPLHIAFLKIFWLR